MSGLSLEKCSSNLKSIALTVLELFHFTHKNLLGHMTLATPLLENLFVVSGLSLEIRVSNLEQ